LKSKISTGSGLRHTPKTISYLNLTIKNLLQANPEMVKIPDCRQAGIHEPSMKSKISTGSRLRHTP